MLALLLLAAASPQASLGSSPELRAAVADRASAGDAAFVAKVEALAARDDASAIQLVGELLLNGALGVARDPQRACAMFGRAAERRGDSAHNFARCHEKGDGLSPDPAKARQWYAKAAKLGNAKSDCALGNMMIAGAGGPKEVAGGVALCRTAAEAGDRDAQTDFANFLLSGQGVGRSVVEARKWYAFAAEQGQPNAQLVLGQIHWNGDGTPVDRDAAVGWWKRAYAGGRKDAARLIVGGLFKRMVLERDGRETIDRSLLPETLIWLQRAATEDPDPARRKRFAEDLANLTQ